MAASAEGPKDQGMVPLFDLVTRHVAPPKTEDGPFRMLAPSSNPIPISAASSPGDQLRLGEAEPDGQGARSAGKLVEEGRVTRCFAFRGLDRTGVDEASAGDIVALAGLPEATVAHTICAPEVIFPLPAQPIDRRPWR